MRETSDSTAYVQDLVDAYADSILAAGVAAAAKRRARSQARAAATKLPAIIHAIHLAHDSHVAGHRTAAGAAAAQAAHRSRQAAKAALRANPATSAAAREAIDGPIRDRRRIANLQSLTLEIGSTKDLSPAEVMQQAVETLAQIEGNAAYKAAMKRRRAGRKYPADGTAAHAASRYRAAPQVVS